MPNEFEIDQSATYAGDDWWEWSVWVEGRKADLDRIEYVEWTLHPTFPKPIRRIDDRSTKFRLETGGWGTFLIRARVEMKDGSSIRLRHELELHYPDGKAATA
jgi:transcription initiation factor IIF auxiliary subunit